MSETQHIFVYTVLIVGAFCYVITLIQIENVGFELHKYKLQSLKEPNQQKLRNITETPNLEQLNNEKTYKLLMARANSSTKTPAKIYFIELLNQTKWHPVTVCSVLSAAKKNPTSLITVFSKNMRMPERWRNLTNLHLTYLDEKRLFANTPLLEWFIKVQQGKRSVFYRTYEYTYVTLMADALRIAILYKYGGMYLDSDTFVLRPFPGEWRNSIAFQSPGVITNGFLAFESGNPCLTRAVDKFTSLVWPSSWGSAGPDLWNKIIKQCLGLNKTSILTTGNHGPILILPKELIYPIKFMATHLLVEPEFYKEARAMLKDAFTVQLWRQMEVMNHPEFGKGSLLNILFKKLCHMDLVSY